MITINQTLKNSFYEQFTFTVCLHGNALMLKANESWKYLIILAELLSAFDAKIFQIHVIFSK